MFEAILRENLHRRLSLLSNRD